MLIVAVDYRMAYGVEIIQPCQPLSSKIGSIPPNRSNGTFRILIDTWILAEVLGSAAKDESRSTGTGSGGLEMVLKDEYSIVPLRT